MAPKSNQWRTTALSGKSSFPLYPSSCFLLIPSGSHFYSFWLILPVLLFKKIQVRLLYQILKDLYNAENCQKVFFMICNNISCLLDLKTKHFLVLQTGNIETAKSNYKQLECLLASTHKVLNK